MVKIICGNKKCGKPFDARAADVARGWGKFCSKACKAHKQGRHLASKETQKMWKDYNREFPDIIGRKSDREEDMDYDGGWDAHNF